jgi:uncharacterized protein (DUF302 family)
MEIDVTLAIFRRAARLRPALATFVVAALMASASVAATAEAPSPSPVAPADGVLRVQSMHGFDETVARLQSAIAGKGVKFFDAIDQAKLGADAGLSIGRSTLVLFGNPPLGVQFLQSNPYSALDWPVRMLVIEDAEGGVFLAWTDFDYIAQRYRISNRPAQFKMASEVAAAIAAEAAR